MFRQGLDRFHQIKAQVVVVARCEKAQLRRLSRGGAPDTIFRYRDPGTSWAHGSGDSVPVRLGLPSPHPL